MKGASLLKRGGFVVYSTCTIEPEENIEIVNKFLSENPNYKLADITSNFDKNLLDENGCIQILPHVHGLDGSFGAKIQRID